MSNAKSLLSLETVRGLNREHHPIRKAEFGDNPIKASVKWLEEALKLDTINPNAAMLATSSKDARPNGRIILLKEITEQGFVFYTHYNSPKGCELEENPLATLLFHWDQLARQLRIAGKIEKLSVEKSDEYFKSRPEGSKISASLSHQSRSVENRESLNQQMDEMSEKLEGEDIPRPEHWGGYVLIPEEIEFWQGQKDRLHDRIKFIADGSYPDFNWNIARLAP